MITQRIIHSYDTIDNYTIRTNTDLYYENVLEMLRSLRSVNQSSIHHWQVNSPLSFDHLFDLLLQSSTPRSTLAAILYSSRQATPTKARRALLVASK
jgi:hypothetical protein